MSEAAIGSAFDSIADVVERAAQLPDHRDRVVGTPTVTCSFARVEVRASTVASFVIRVGVGAAINVAIGQAMNALLGAE